jgi:hypothetical protein
MTMPTFTDGTLVAQGPLNLLSTGINNLSTYLLGAVPPRSYVPQAALHQTVAQSIPNITDVLLSFTTADSNTDNMWVGSQPNQLTVKTAGTYAVFAQASLKGTSPDNYLFILMNGTNTSTNSVAEDHQNGNNSGDGCLLHCSALLPSLAAGATFYVSVWQNSGAGFTTAIDRSTARFYAWRIGP